jgi:ketol-acid reductoisomerase
VWRLCRTLAYSHGFNIVEEGMQVRPDITVIMVAPKCPGTEVREEYKRGFGVPTLLAVHPENDPEGKGLAQAKASVFLLIETCLTHRFAVSMGFMLSVFC